MEAIYIAWCEADSKCLRTRIVMTKLYSVSNLSRHIRMKEEAKNGQRRAGIENMYKDDIILEVNT